jgi:hypothetical protein
MKFLLPQGIGDSVWALLKIQDIANKLGDGVIDIFLNTQNADYRENRAVGFISKFKFVNSVGQIVTPITKDVYPPLDKDGYYIYLDDGPPTNGLAVDCILIPNRTLERGQRIETWMPNFKINWQIMYDFQFSDAEITFAMNLKREGEYCVFYLGPETGNTIDGHNRNALWSPDDWAKLGDFVTGYMGLRIVLVGAEYDLNYWVRHVQPLVAHQNWIDLLGQMEISRTFAVCRRANFVISYQSGIGIVSEYMGVPSALFWRQKGDSISPYPNFYTSFEEDMNGAWSPPEMLKRGRHMALFYGRHDWRYVCKELVRRKW